MVFFLTVLADANFPSASICKHGPEHVRADGKTTVHVCYGNQTLFTEWSGSWTVPIYCSVGSRNVALFQ